MTGETRTPYDASSDGVAWVVGSGIMLIQASAVVIGLLPCLVLLLPLALPLLLLPLLALPVALVAGIARLAARALSGPRPSRQGVRGTAASGVTERKLKLSSR